MYHFFLSLFFLEDQDSTIEKNLFDHMICHHEDTPVLLNISGQKYVLPANCSFLLSDASNLNPLLDYGRSPIIIYILTILYLISAISDYCIVRFSLPCVTHKSFLKCVLLPFVNEQFMYLNAI